MSEAKVWLAGEGKNEVGTWAHEAPYGDGSRRGVLEALARRVQPTGWSVTGATVWKAIRSYSTRAKLRGDAKNVMGAALDAHESGCDALLFSRDTDGDPDRARAVAEGLALASEEFSGLCIVGGCVEPKIEAWVLALCGHVRTEDRRDIDALTEKEAIGSTERMVEVVEGAGLEEVPVDAHSLRAWIETARTELPKVVERARTSEAG